MIDITWHTEQRRLGDLVEWDKNPRRLSKHDAEHIKKSLAKFGVADPLIINTDNTLIGGHQRKRILGDVEMLVDVRVPSRLLTPEEAEELAIRLNKNNGEWDWDKLVANFDKDHLIDYGFTDDELNGLKFSGQAPDDEGPKLDQAEELRAKWGVELGQLWQLGEHRLICGDCTDRATVGRLLGAEHPQIMVTDPPYGVKYDPSWRSDVGLSDSDRTGKVDNDDRASWAMAFRLFPGDVAYIWHAACYSTVVERAIVSCGFDIRSQIIWVKSHLAISRGQYHWRHEACWFAVRKQQSAHWAGGRKQNTVWADIIDVWKPSELMFAGPIDEKTLIAFKADMTTVWEIGTDASEAKTTHGTQKPLECMERPIRNHDFKIVYDPFLGSGTTLVASERLGRSCYAAEINPAYVAVSIQRWVDMTGKDPVIIHD